MIDGASELRKRPISHAFNVFFVTRPRLWAWTSGSSVFFPPKCQFWVRYTVELKTQVRTLRKLKAHPYDYRSTRVKWVSELATKKLVSGLATNASCVYCFLRTKGFTEKDGKSFSSQEKAEAPARLCSGKSLTALSAG